MGALGQALKTATPRERMFTRATAVVYGVALVVAAVLAVLHDEQGDDRTLYAAVVAVLAGAPLAVGGLSLALFGARRRLGKVGGTVGMGLFVLLTVGGFFLYIPVFLQGARWMMRGTESGTITAIAASNASWVEVAPAAIDTAHIGEGIVESRYITTGYIRAHRRYAAPIIAAEATDAPVTLFACARDRDDLVEHAQRGAIRGRMAAPELGDSRAIESLRGAIRIAAQPKCIRPAAGSGGATGLVWLGISIAILAFALWLATFTALAFSRVSPRYGSVAT